MLANSGAAELVASAPIAAMTETAASTATNTRRRFDDRRMINKLAAITGTARVYPASEPFSRMPTSNTMEAAARIIRSPE